LFYKIKRSPKNLELNINTAKVGNSAFFRGKQQIPRQTANSAAQRENPRAQRENPRASSW